jgi:ribosome biogenesis GTPase
MDLKSLGWDNHFQNALDRLGFEGVGFGRISKVAANGSKILTVSDEVFAVNTGKIKSGSISEIPVIGDWVVFKPSDLKNVIIKVLSRKNWISRKTSGKGSGEQIIGANIDVIFIVMGLDGDFNQRRLERYLFMANESEIEPIVVLNKSDLVKDNILKERIRAVKESTQNVVILSISALQENGLEQISDYVRNGKTATLVGSSGAGKSTIINKLLYEEKQVIKQVREKDSHGRHATTSREMFLLPNGGIIIDNPGIRELQLWGDVGTLDEIFNDINELARTCKFKNCSHVNEPKCSVKLAINEGRLSEKRYENYLKMRMELAYLEKRRGMSSEAIEKDKWKGVTGKAEQYRKFKKNDY